MSRGAEGLVKDLWRGQQLSREVYADFNDLTLQIVTNVLFGFSATNSESKAVTRMSLLHHACSTSEGTACTSTIPQY